MVLFPYAIWTSKAILFPSRLKRLFDLVCVDCLTPYESDQVDAYFAREYPSKYSKEHAEALIQAASKMLQERLAK
jgi:hypothetical protein